MNAVDTNILLRFLMNDDAPQSKLVYNLFKRTEKKEDELFVPAVVVLEMI